MVYINNTNKMKLDRFYKAVLASILGLISAEEMTIMTDAVNSRDTGNEWTASPTALCDGAFKSMAHSE